jgi:hypothetical protein
VVEPAIYAANIENCGDCWMTVYLDRQHGAFHGTNPELGWQIRRPALDRHLSLSTTDTTIMISRADCGRN